jgi:CubicO group peptidase (beta-lactamase class C family)
MTIPRQCPGKFGRRRFLLLAAAAAASTALSACSSGSPTATPTTTAPATTSAQTAIPSSATSPTASAASVVTPPLAASPAPTRVAASAPVPATGTSVAGTPVGTSAVPVTVAPDASAPFRAVAAKMQAILAANKVPGASLGILSGGREEYADFGVANVGTKEAVAGETLFQMGSLTKTYTATAVMRLMQQGKINLDATVRTYLPDLKLADEATAAQVTIKNLLTHTGGWWGDAFVDTGNGDDALARYMAEKLPTFPQIAPVGQYFSYSNSGFIVAGRVIEVVTGMTYRAAIQTLVLDPLGMSPTTFTDDALTHPHALGYGVEGGAVKEVMPLALPRNVDPAGGLWSTARADPLCPLPHGRWHRRRCVHLEAGNAETDADAAAGRPAYDEQPQDRPELVRAGHPEHAPHRASRRYRRAACRIRRRVGEGIRVRSPRERGAGRRARRVIGAGRGADDLSR